MTYVVYYALITFENKKRKAHFIISKLAVSCNAMVEQ